MTREQAQKLRKVFNDFCDGETVQFRYAANTQWHTATNPTFDSELEWRTKPKPIECWVNVYDAEEREPFGRLHETKGEAISRRDKDVDEVRTVKLREVEE